MLRSLTLIDTPGVLSGEKQKAREYDFRAVTKARVIDVLCITYMCVCQCVSSNVAVPYVCANKERTGVKSDSPMHSQIPFPPTHTPKNTVVRPPERPDPAPVRPLQAGHLRRAEAGHRGPQALRLQGKSIELIDFIHGCDCLIRLVD